MPSSFFSKSALKGPTPFKYSMGFFKNPFTATQDYFMSTLTKLLSDTKLTKYKIELFLVSNLTCNFSKILQTSSYLKGY